MTLDILRRLADGGAQPVRVGGLIGTACTPGGSWPVVKFWITNDMALVYADVNGTPQLVAGADIESFAFASTPAERPAWKVTTVDGEVWELEATGNCGCGSSLPNFSPFPPPNRMGT